LCQQRFELSALLLAERMGKVDNVHVFIDLG